MPAPELPHRRRRRQLLLPLCLSSEVWEPHEPPPLSHPRAQPPRPLQQQERPERLPEGGHWQVCPGPRQQDSAALPQGLLCQQGWAGRMPEVPLGQVYALERRDWVLVVLQRWHVRGGWHLLILDARLCWRRKVLPNALHAAVAGSRRPGMTWPAFLYPPRSSLPPSPIIELGLAFYFG